MTQPDVDNIWHPVSFLWSNEGSPFMENLKPHDVNDLRCLQERTFAPTDAVLACAGDELRYEIGSLRVW